MLQYDNSAFYFFVLSTLSFYLVPSWYNLLHRVYKAFQVTDETIGAVARTTAEQKKALALKKESRGVQTLQERSFLIHLGVTLVCTALFVWLLYNVSQDGEVNVFDPFSILGIDHDADSKAIKKAYRSLSLEYHPDKNPGNRAAAAKFMMVSKAYETLTDETAKKNFAQFGNPDGKQSLEVSIGLPDFLLESQNRNLVLLAYLVVMVVVVPFCVWTYYSDSSKYGEKNVMYDTYAWYHNCLEDHTLTKQLPEILAGSAEFRQRNRPTTEKDKEAIGQLMSKVRSQMYKPKYTHPVLIKGNVLLHAHLLRHTDLLNEADAEDLKNMLKHSVPLVDAMISVCKNMDALQTAINCIEFGQYMTQAMWVKDSTLLQLPHFTEEEVKHVQKGKTKVTTVAEFQQQDEEDRKGMVDFTDEQKQDVANFLKIYPNISVDVKVFCDDDEDSNVYEGDLLTIEVKITRNNLEDGERAGLIHSPLFPFPRKESFWVILGQMREGKIIYCEQVADPRKYVTHKIKFMAPPKGRYEFDLLVKSNGYVGVDQKVRVEMETLDASQLPEYKVHPDDAELDDEPTLFEEMLNAHVEQDSDDEDDEDEDDEDDSEDEDTDQAAAKKKAQLRKARQAADDDDSDDDEDVKEVYTDK